MHLPSRRVPMRRRMGITRRNTPVKIQTLSRLQSSRLSPRKSLGGSPHRRNRKRRHDGNGDPSSSSRRMFQQRNLPSRRRNVSLFRRISRTGVRGDDVSHRETLDDRRCCRWRRRRCLLFRAWKMCVDETISDDERGVASFVFEWYFLRWG